MSRERIFSKYFNTPHNGTEIDVKVFIEYEATNWDQENTGDIDVIDAWFSRDEMTQAEIDSAQAWLDQTPLDFFHDAAFQNECDIYNEPTLFLQP
jgi:hypothetical protein